MPKKKKRSIPSSSPSAAALGESKVLARLDKLDGAGLTRLNDAAADNAARTALRCLAECPASHAVHLRATALLRTLALSSASEVALTALSADGAASLLAGAMALHRDAGELQAGYLRLLSLLAFDETNKRAIVEHGGLARAVAALDGHRDALPVQEAACQLLQVRTARRCSPCPRSPQQPAAPAAAQTRTSLVPVTFWPTAVRTSVQPVSA